MPEISRHALFTLAAAGLMGGLAPAGASAQSLILGRVRSGGQPVAKAEVLIAARQLRTETSDSGTFRLAVADPGAVDLLVRAIGHKATAARLTLGRHDTLTVDVTLEAGTQRLDPVEVEAPPPVVAGKMRGFEERRRLGLGKFLTREFLAAREYSTVANVLRTASGLRLIRRPERCGGGWAAATGHGGGGPQSCRGQRMEVACYAAVYLDGLRYWAPGDAVSDGPPDIDQFRIVDLEGIELYRSSAEAPIQFPAARSDCGVLVLWTRVGRG